MEKLTILMYHSLDKSGSVTSVSPEAFAAQMAALADAGWRGISVAEALAQRATLGRWPARAVVLTFDDGYANTHRRALPVLARHGFSATAFLVNEYIGRNIACAPRQQDKADRAALSWSQVHELIAAGLEVGAHTRTHQDLSDLRDADVEQEIIASRRELEIHLQRKVTSFAYPFGRLSKLACEIAAQEFEASCTTELQRVNGDPSWRLPRVDMYYISQPQQLVQLAEGKLDGYLAVRRWGRTARRALPRDSYLGRPGPGH